MAEIMKTIEACKNDPVKMELNKNPTAEIAKSPYTGHFGLGNAKCAEMQMQWRRCADRVGMQHTPYRCKELFEDYQECLWNMKYYKRIKAIKHQMVVQNRPPPQIPPHAL